MDDHGLYCDACGTVTLYERDAHYPRGCGRCEAVLRDAPRPPEATARAQRRERERAAREDRDVREARSGRRAA